VISGYAVIIAIIVLVLFTAFQYFSHPQLAGFLSCTLISNSLLILLAQLIISLRLCQMWKQLLSFCYGDFAVQQSQTLQSSKQ
jgi:uncharacterized membrane protein